MVAAVGWFFFRFIIIIILLLSLLLLLLLILSLLILKNVYFYRKLHKKQLNRSAYMCGFKICYFIVIRDLQSKV